MTRWTAAVREAVERTRRDASPRSAKQANERTPQFRLEPLEPRILLSADIGLVPDDAHSLLPPDIERLERQVEIHDEVLAREIETRVDDVEDGAAGEASPDEGSPAPEVTDEANEVDPTRADEALREQVWQAALEEHVERTVAAEAEQAARQIVVIDARVPEVGSLLASLVEGTEDLARADDPASEAQDADNEPAVEAERESAADVDASSELRESLAGEGDDGATAADAASASIADSIRALEERGVQVVVLDAERDGVEQIGEILEAYHGVAALHVVSHGASGTLRLGATALGVDELRERSDALSAWREALGEDADLLLYGCDVADGEVGIEFIEALANATGADVAASTDATGSAALGGDWELEVATGSIEADALAAPGFAALLAPAQTVTITGDATANTISLSFSSTTGLWSVTGAASVTDENGVALVGPFMVVSTGTIDIDAGDGADFIFVDSVDPSFAGTLNLRGGTGDDTYVLNDLVLPPGATVVTEQAAAGHDTIDFAGNDPGFVQYVDTTIEAYRGVDISGAIAALEAGLDALVAWAERLSSAGLFGSPLAGVNGNVDVSLGTALDFAEALDQLRVSLDTASITSATDLIDQLEAIRREGVAQLDRSIAGDVASATLVSPGQLGFEIRLDSDDAFFLGHRCAGGLDLHARAEARGGTARLRRRGG